MSKEAFPKLIQKFSKSGSGMYIEKAEKTFNENDETRLLAVKSVADIFNSSLHKDLSKYWAFNN